MRASGVLALALIGTGWAIPSLELQDSLDRTLENIEARRGVEIGGTIRSSMLSSKFSSDQDINAYDISPDNERDGFSQLDLKFGFRPWQQTRANAVLRLFSNYQDFFNAGAKVVSVPWVNVEGQVSDKFYWVAGDFRQQYSPLTLFSPDVEIMYEPEVYRRSRHMARDQVFLQGNQRNLQGANMQYRDDFGDMFGEVRADLLVTRLRRVEQLDFSGAMGNILPNEANTSGASQASGMDKMLYGGNFEWFPYSRHFMVGVTPLIIKDIKTSETGYYQLETDEETGETGYVYRSMNPGVLGPENSQVISIRAGADGGAFIGDSAVVLDVVLEYATSKDKAYTWNDDGTQIEATDYSGSAIMAQLTAGYGSKGSWMVRANMEFLMNDSSWYNTLAQSPSFFARRVANSDKDGDVMKLGAQAPLYSTFDALYHFVPKFSPVSKNLVADPTKNNQTESYNIAPFSKNSWNTGVYTRDELALINSLSDPYLQTALPNGVATANRTGPRVNLLAGLGEKNWLEGQVLFTSLQEVTASTVEKAKFSEIGGGAKIDVDHFIGRQLPLEFSGSYKMSTTTVGSNELNSNFVNAGFYGKYHKRFGATAGFQAINSEYKLPDSDDWSLRESKQMQWMAGLDYNLARNAWLALNVGQILVTNTFRTSDATATDGDGLPSYILAELASASSRYAGKTELEHSFQQNLVEANINVDF